MKKKTTLIFAACLSSLGLSAQTFVQVNFTAPDLPVAFAGNDTTVVESEPFQLSGSVTGGAAPYTFEWEPAGSLNNAAVANPTGTISSSTDFTLTVKDSNNCFGSDGVFVDVIPLSVGENSAGDNLRIFPNPTSGELRITGLPAGVKRLKIKYLHLPVRWFLPSEFRPEMNQL